MRCCSSHRSTIARFRPFSRTRLIGAPGPMAAIHGRESPQPSPEPRPAPSATAIAQQHLRQILGDLGALVMGGEAYITFKPGLIDDAGTITDESTRKFLQAFVDQFTTLLARLNGSETAARAA